MRARLRAAAAAPAPPPTNTNPPPPPPHYLAVGPELKLEELVAKLAAVAHVVA
jgi:hypothetical protein